MFTGKSNLEDFDSFHDGVPDIGSEIYSLAALLLVLEGVVLIVLKEMASFNRLHDPVSGENITPEVGLLSDILTNRSHLVSETLVEITDEAAVFLDQELHIVPVFTVWQIENHGCRPNNRQILNEDRLSAHF